MDVDPKSPRSLRLEMTERPHPLYVYIYICIRVDCSMFVSCIPGRGQVLTYRWSTARTSMPEEAISEKKSTQELPEKDMLIQIDISI